MNTSEQQEIKLLLEKINLLFRIFEKEGFQKISSLEKELLKEQASNLLDAINKLQSESPVQSHSNDNGSELSKKPPVPKYVHEEPSKEKTEVPPTELKVVKSEEPEVPIVQKQEAVEVPTNSKLEVKSSANLSLNERIAKMKDNNETSLNSSKGKYRNMREIIDLNKSFVFRKELFNNDKLIYDKFINELNVTESEEAAMSLVDKYANELGWDKEDKAYELICRAAEKRFLPIL